MPIALSTLSEPVLSKQDMSLLRKVYAINQLMEGSRTIQKNIEMLSGNAKCSYTDAIQKFDQIDDTILRRVDSLLRLIKVPKSEVS